jgi:hypothetical protein
MIFKYHAQLSNNIINKNFLFVCQNGRNKVAKFLL